MIRKSGLLALFVFALLSMITASLAGATTPAVQGYQVIGDEVHIGWLPVENATLYKIYRSTDNLSYSYVGESTGTGFVDTPPAPGDYYYKIETIVGNTTYNSTVLVKYYPLQTPQDLVAIIKGSSIYLHWQPVQGAKQYKIYRDNILIGVTQGTTFTDIEHNVGAYTYSVVAMNGKTISSPARVTLNLGGSGNIYLIAGIAINSYIFYIGGMLFIIGAALEFYAAGSHKDVAKYALLAGIALILIAILVGTFLNYPILNQTFNLYLMIIGAGLAISGVIIYFTGRSHRDEATFAIVVGVLTAVLSFILAHWVI